MQIYGGYYIYICVWYVYMDINLSISIYIYIFPRCYKVFGNFSWFPKNRVYLGQKSAVPDKVVYWKVSKDIEIKV